MSPLDRAVLAERVSALERHLARVADRLPATPEELAASAATHGPDDLRTFVTAALPRLLGS